MESPPAPGPSSPLRPSSCSSACGWSTRSHTRPRAATRSGSSSAQTRLNSSAAPRGPVRAPWLAQRQVQFDRVPRGRPRASVEPRWLDPRQQRPDSLQAPRPREAGVDPVQLAATRNRKTPRRLLPAGPARHRDPSPARRQGKAGHTALAVARTLRGAHTTTTGKPPSMDLLPPPSNRCSMRSRAARGRLPLCPRSPLSISS